MSKYFKNHAHRTVNSSFMVNNLYVRKLFTAAVVLYSHSYGSCCRNEFYSLVFTPRFIANLETTLDVRNFNYHVTDKCLLVYNIGEPKQITHTVYIAVGRVLKLIR